MNIYELLNRFWLENEYDPCSATEIALYFFLQNKANTRRWKMAFRCSTELIRMQLSTTRQNVLKAREGLHKRDLSHSPQAQAKATMHNTQ